MASNDFRYEGQLPVNFEQKCPLVLVLDTSGSMHGEPIVELNKGLKAFQDDIQNDIVASAKLEISIVTFGSTVNVIQDFTLINEFIMPTLSDDGSTPLVDAMSQAFNLLDDRKSWYRQTGQQFYRPYVVLITDGYPDNNQDTAWLQKEILAKYNGSHLNCWFFGVEGADMSLLKKLSHDGSLVEKLKGLEFVKFFKWLSTSMTTITNSKEDDAIDIAPKSQGENPFQITVK